MTFITYLVILTAMQPAPSFTVVGHFSTQQKCLSYIEESATRLELKKEDVARMSCLTVVTSKLIES